MSANVNPPHPPTNPPRASWHMNDVMLAVIVGLSLIGIVVNKFTPQDAFIYWFLMLIMSAAAAVFSGWWQARESGYLRGYTAQQLRHAQLIHWGSSFVITLSLPLLMQENRLDNESASLIVLLILAHSLFQDGLRIGWRYSLAGAYLGATALVEAYMSESFIYIMLPVAIALIYLNINYWKPTESPEDQLPTAAPTAGGARGLQSPSATRQLARQPPAPAALPPTTPADRGNQST